VAKRKSQYDSRLSALIRLIRSLVTGQPSSYLNLSNALLDGGLSGLHESTLCNMRQGQGVDRSWQSQML
jgi:hypothetical protein